MIASSAAGGLAVLVVLGFGLYMLPTVIGAVRKVVNVGSVFAINLLLGWTLIGWAVALAMALRTNPPHAYPQVWAPSVPVPQQQIPGFVLPPAGWYPDPSDPSSQRWWDGQRWTASASQLQQFSTFRQGEVSQGPGSGTVG